MFAVGTYDEIIKHEREKMFPEVVVFLFVKPTTKETLDIIREFEYIHFNSGMSCSVYAIGYSNDFTKRNDRSYRKIKVEDSLECFFSNKAFVEFKQELERRINWEYSGEIDILVLQNNPGHSNCLNFKNYVAVNINRGLRQKYIDSFQQFMEELIRVCIRNEEDVGFSATNSAVKISVGKYSFEMYLLHNAIIYLFFKYMPKIQIHQYVDFGIAFILISTITLIASVGLKNGMKIIKNVLIRNGKKLNHG